MNLPRGRDAAITIGDLAERSGQSRRAVEKQLEELAQTQPIISGSDGVWLATSAAEARQHADSLRGRIVAVQARISALERWAAEQDHGYQQTSLFEEAA